MENTRFVGTMAVVTASLWVCAPSRSGGSMLRASVRLSMCCRGNGVYRALARPPVRLPADKRSWRSQGRRHPRLRPKLRARQSSSPRVIPRSADPPTSGRQDGFVRNHNACCCRCERTTRPMRCLSSSTSSSTPNVLTRVWTSVRFETEATKHS